MEVTPEENVMCAQTHMEAAIDAVPKWATAEPGSVFESSAFQTIAIALLHSIAHTSAASAQLALKGATT